MNCYSSTQSIHRKCGFILLTVFCIFIVQVLSDVFGGLRHLDFYSTDDKLGDPPFCHSTNFFDKLAVSLPVSTNQNDP
jgi:hypothetical protein